MPDSAPEVILATRNAHKIGELREILARTGVAVRLVGLESFPDLPEVAETGLTFAENALIKASDVAHRTGIPAIADDSGLCVDVLGGMPGIFSARWSGKHGDDAGNLDLLLAQISDVADEHRRAHFTCAAALVIPANKSTQQPATSDAASGQPSGSGVASGQPVIPEESSKQVVREGIIEGTLLRARRGENGFGYDPIFVPDGYDRTTAEMSSDEKNAISHRTRAFQALAEDLAELL